MLDKRDNVALRIWVDRQPQALRRRWQAALRHMPSWMLKGVAAESRRLYMGEYNLWRATSMPIVWVAAFIVRACS